MKATQSRAPGRNPTIFDVAALAGVSKSTVSNVVRGNDGVSAATRARVERAIEILGYRPNVLARQFVSQRTTILGVLVGDLDNPFYGDLAKRLERLAFRSGYTTMFCNIEGAGDEEADFAASRVEALLEQRPAGVVFLAFFGRSPDIAAALGGVPVVFAGLREDWGDSVAVSNSAGGKLATEHLLDLGHRRIAYLTTHSLERRAHVARHRGYQAAMRGAGVDPAPPIHWGPGSEEATVKGADLSLLDQLRDTTAVFCSNDIGAIAVLEYADRHGLRVPEDLSVVGFDDVHLASLARISLTTIRQPFDDIARIAVDTLLGRLSGTLEGPPRHTQLAPALVVRSSTAAPAAT
ncbi:MAG TPA: LacI family DNA-binding transcriptional regulator [Thermoleophilaceae bacterium]